ncbi:MFS transporter [Cupriavidus gilardii]|uniref:MFS transporter n=1 Tax=Cupriavidus gilardii TaxID=82541 RepID=A0ABY4VLT2_9BURK|nr:MFS transporter [Cupriavidus gilardii]USE77009.1 MFS transporter [Cupriavidus gilardii]
MSKPSIRTVLPLATITAASMLTMDLYLPAVPTMQRDLGITVAQGQLTIAIFLLGLAASQLVWGEMLHRIGPRRCVQTGLLALILTSFGCALAPDLPVLLGLRLIQGIAAGAATVVVPTVVRATLPEQDGVRGIAAIAMIEAIVPAAGPVLGTALLLIADWRTTFAIIGIVALVSAPFALRATPVVLPETEEKTGRVGYRALLRNWHFVGLALAHSLSFGALIAFVASAPQVLPALAGTGQSGFALAQVCGVAGFIVAASQAGRISNRLGPRHAIQLGALLHGLLCTALLAAWWADRLSYPWLLAFWAAFCAVLGIRGPTAFSEALSVPNAQLGRASALMVLALLATGALATQATAPFLPSGQLGAVALSMTLLCWASFALVVRYPDKQSSARPQHRTEQGHANP